LSTDDLPLWSIDVDEVRRSIVVHAATVELARERARLFLGLQRAAFERLIQEVQTLDSVVIQGRVIERGVRLTVHY
jgi:hypothetical protein